MLFRNPQQAFNEAIASGSLSNQATDSHYAGNYLYMHTENADDGLWDAFKHVMTRAYIRVKVTTQ